MQRPIQIGRYEILAELGQGAMGAVYKARDPLMDRTVAIKTILAAALTGPFAQEYRDRFAREARAAGRLAHAHIVSVYDVGEHEGTPYLVMEYVAGRTLPGTYTFHVVIGLSGGAARGSARAQFAAGQERTMRLELTRPSGLMGRPQLVVTLE
jgi:serine/threonine protein kinase